MNRKIFENESMDDRILQIIPANDWYAVYEDVAGMPFFSRVVYWALIENDACGNVVIGMTANELGITEVPEGTPYCHADRKAVFEADWRIKQHGIM